MAADTKRIGGSSSVEDNETEQMNCRKNKRRPVLVRSHTGTSSKWRKQEEYPQTYWAWQRPKENQQYNYQKQSSPLSTVMLYFTAVIPLWAHKTNQNYHQ